MTIFSISAWASSAWMTFHIPPRSSFSGISGKLWAVDKNNHFIFLFCDDRLKRTWIPCGYRWFVKRCWPWLIIFGGLFHIQNEFSCRFESSFQLFTRCFKQIKRSGFMFFNLFWRNCWYFIYIIGYKNFIIHNALCSLPESSFRVFSCWLISWF